MQKMLLYLAAIALCNLGQAMEKDIKDVYGSPIHTNTFKDSKTPNDDDAVKIIPWPGTHKAHPTLNNFGTSALHGYIQPQFVEKIYAKPGLKALEVAPADGLLLELILNDKRNLTTPIHYTVVEPCKEHLTAIDKVINTHSKNPDNYFGKAKKGDIREFIKDKENMYDLILCSQLLLYFDPVDQLAVLQGFQKSLKEGGQVFFITHGFLAVNLWIRNSNERELQEKSIKYIQEMKKIQKQGDLWPGYNFDKFFSVLTIKIKQLASFPFDLPNLHSPTSFKSLLEAVGFDVKECCNFTEEKTDHKTVWKDDSGGEWGYYSTVRLGAIAQKGTPNAVMVQKYKNAALLKRHERQKVEKWGNKMLAGVASMLMEGTRK